MKKICFIAPYVELATAAATVVREKGLNIDVHQCPIQESVAFARAGRTQGYANRR